MKQHKKIMIIIYLCGQLFCQDILAQSGLMHLQHELSIDHPYGHIITAYRKEFGYNQTILTCDTLDIDCIVSMCHAVINSSTCSDVSEDNLLKCSYANIEQISSLQNAQDTVSGALSPLWGAFLYIVAPFKLQRIHRDIKNVKDTVHNIAMNIEDELRGHYQEASYIYPYNLVNRIVAATGLTIASNAKEIITSTLTDMYETHQKFHCYHLEHQARISIEAIGEVAISAVAGPAAKGIKIAKRTRRQSNNSSGENRRNEARDDNQNQDNSGNGFPNPSNTQFSNDFIKDRRKISSAYQEKLDKYIEDIQNGQATTSSYIPKKLANEPNVYRVHIHGQSLVACFRLLRGNVWKFVFVGSHEKAGRKYKICKSRF